MKSYFFLEKLTQAQSGRSLAVFDRLHVFKRIHQPAQIATFDANYRLNHVVKELDGLSGKDVVNLYATFSGVDFINEELTVTDYTDSKGVVFMKDYLDTHGRTRVTEFLTQDSKKPDRLYVHRTVYFATAGETTMEVFWSTDGGVRRSRVRTPEGWHYFADENNMINEFVCQLGAESGVTFFSDLLNERLQQAISKNVNNPIATILHSEHMSGDSVRAGYRVAVLENPTNRYLVPATDRQKAKLATQSKMPAVVIAPVSLGKPVSLDGFTKLRGRITVASRIDPVKDMVSMIEAVIRVHQTNPEVSLAIFGGVSDAKYLDTLTDLITTKHADTYITIGEPTKFVEAEYAQAELTLMASEQEGFARTLIEAMNQGAVPVSYPTEYGPLDMIDSGVDGIITSGRSVDDMAEAIKHLLDDDADRERMSAAARIKAAGYSQVAIDKRWAGLVNQLQEGIR